ncbi:serine hydrolase [Phytomonospora endophytica]|nr:serine hydrolase [Phytomonospora endophytica]
MRDHLDRFVGSGVVPGAGVVLAHRGEVQVVAVGTLAFEGAGATTPMAADTILRMGSMSKPFTAACAMTLVEDGTLRLDDPLDDLLPELADMRVLADPLGPLSDTVPAKRPVTLRGLLDSTFGTGMVMTASPIAEALGAVGRPEPDEWMRRLGTLPLVHQPGEAWLYDTAANVTGVLIARATGTSFGEALRERVFGPLGMKDSGFTVDPAELGRFATAYAKDDAPDGSPVVDDPPDGQWSRPQTFESGGGGLLSTGHDYLTFVMSLLSGEGVLSRASVELMTTDQLTPSQKKLSGFGPDYFDAMGWGFGMGVATGPNRSGHATGTYGWPGYYGTAWYTDPAEENTTIVLMQREHMGNQNLPVWDEFWAAVYGVG